MANSGSIGIIRDVENFLTDDIGSAGDGVKWVVSSDSSDTAFVRAVAAGKGMHCAGALTTTDNNMIELCSDVLHVYGQDGYNALEVLFQVDVATDLAINIGFNDDSLDGGNTLPVELATATWTTTSSTFVGLAFDVDATNDDWHCMWVDDDADAALADLRMTGATLTASKWVMARVAIQDRGSGKGVRATFTISQDGKSFEKVFDTSVDRDCALCPYIGFENRAATAHNVYIKYIIQEQSIAD